MPTKFWGTALVAALAMTMSGQQEKRTLPPDIIPDSMSRLPLVKRADMDDNGKRVYDLISGPNRTSPLLGPGGVSFYSPKPAEYIHLLNEYLRRESQISGRYFELSALVAAREFDQQYEWSGHEPAALRAGLEQNVIDVVKYNRELTGLNEKDRVVIQMGREVFCQHHVSPAVFAKTVELFGRQGTMEIVETLGDYALAAVMLTAVDHQLPADRKPLLPVK